MANERCEGCSSEIGWQAGSKDYGYCSWACMTNHKPEAFMGDDYDPNVTPTEWQGESEQDFYKRVMKPVSSKRGK